MSKRVVCLLSILLLIGLSAPVASADPDSAALARTAPVVQPAIYTPTAAKPALVKPSVVKPRIPAPKASFGFRVGGMQAKPRIVLPRDGAPTTDRSTFQGFGGAFAKPACRVELTRPAPSLQGAAKTLAKCTSGCCSDGVTYFDEADEVVVSERFVPVGQEDGPPRMPVDGYNPSTPDNAPYTKHYSVCCTPNCNDGSSCDTCSSCNDSSCSDCCGCDPCARRACRPVVRRVCRPAYRPCYRPAVYVRPACGWGWGRPYWGGYGWRGGWGWGGYGWGGGGWGWGGCW